MIKRSSLAVVAAAVVALAGGPALASGDADKGEKVFKKCQTCHTTEAGKNKIGPSLAGVVGRKAASADGFKYSEELQAAAAKGLVWDEKALSDYIADPKDFLRTYLGDNKANSKMTFKLKKDDDREDLIAYLKGK